MNVIWPCGIYCLTQNKPTQTLSFNVTDIEGCVHLDCADILAPVLVLASDKQDKKKPSSAKLVISQTDSSTLFTINKKTQVICAFQLVDNQVQTCTDNQAILHTKAYLMKFYPDCFTRLSEFQGEPYHTEVDPGVPAKMTPYKSVLIHKQEASNSNYQNASCSYPQATGPCHTLHQQLCHSQ